VVEVAPRGKKKLRKSFTREFKLRAITMVYGTRINAKGTEVPAGIRCIAAAWLWLHQYKQDTIVKAFEQTGISLCPSGKDDHKLHVHGTPDLVVGSWQIELESDEELE